MRGKRMKYDPKIHHRKSIRLKGYDYTQAGLYFITICCQNREHLFGEIVGEKMVLNDAGIIVEKIWNEIPVYYNGFDIHQFIVMPNHIHGIIEIVVGAGPRACPGPCACPINVQPERPNNGRPESSINGQTESSINGRPESSINGRPESSINGQPRGVARTASGDIGQPRGVAPTALAIL